MPTDQTAKDEAASEGWHWSEHGTLVTADGYIVLTARAHLRVLDNGNTIADASVWVEPQWRSLVAAAPDLLEALRELERYADEIALILKAAHPAKAQSLEARNAKAHAAIKRATEG